MSTAFLFVAVLPYLQYTYVEAVPDMGERSWLECHVHAYGFFAGPEGPFVITSIITERENKERHSSHADFCDMTANRLWQRDDGRFYWEVMHSCVDPSMCRRS